MTEESTPGGLRYSVLALFIPVFFMVGCGSIAESQQSIPVVAMPEPPLDAKVEPKSPETTSLAEKSPSVVIDEKSSIFFSLGSSSISPLEKNKLRDVANLLKNDKAMRVTLIGYSNDNGSSSFNIAVADARVESVGTVLKKLGVKPHQIKKNVIGGEKVPSVWRSAEYRRKMRRVELVISTARRDKK